MAPSNENVAAKNREPRSCTLCENPVDDPIFVVGRVTSRGLPFCSLLCLDSWILSLLIQTGSTPKGD